MAKRALAENCRGRKPLPSGVRSAWKIVNRTGNRIPPRFSPWISFCHVSTGVRSYFIRNRKTRCFDEPAGQKRRKHNRLYGFCRATREGGKVSNYISTILELRDDLLCPLSCPGLQLPHRDNIFYLSSIWGS